MKAGDKIKKMIKSFLDIKEPQSLSINIEQLYTLDTLFFLNELWYRGQENELQDFYEQIDDHMGNNSFWASKPTESFNIRKTHSGLPFIIVEMFVNIMTNDMVEIKVGGCRQEDWNKIAEENEFKNTLKNSIRGILVQGDGAFKISYDTAISKYPIIEWWTGKDVDFEIKRGRISACIFKSKIHCNNKEYLLKEKYSLKGIDYYLFYNEKQVDFPQELSEYRTNLINQNEFMMAIPVKYGQSRLFKGRGEGVINCRISKFDKFDETISLWRLANRKGQVKTYMPENLMPVNSRGYHDGLNYFDNDFIVTEAEIREGVENKITTSRADIPAEELLSSYCTDLDACLCGLISPSTLGIDVKKLDNAESQREKEKTTMYTRGQLIEIYQSVLPKLVNAVIKTYDTYNNKTVSDINVDVNFGEYANPSFEAVVETMSKARGSGNPVISIEAQIDELWGDSKDEEWKQKEIIRLKEEMGISNVSEPAVNNELFDDEIVISNE